jgi:carboxyl-terminal processing protease
LLLVLAAFVGGAITSYHASATSRGDATYAPLDQLARVLAIVEANYVEATQRSKLTEGAIKGLVSELDPHSSYLTPSELADLRGETEGQYAGVGLEVDLHNDVIIVIAPIEGSPSARAGIRPGDEILAIDGRPARGERIEKLIAMMRGVVGSSVTLTVHRPGVADAMVVPLVRALIHVESVTSKRLKNNVAYVRVKQFQEGTHSELVRAAARLQSEPGPPIAGVLLDLRNNPGGLVDEAEAVADELMSSGVIYTTRHRGEVLDTAMAHDGGVFAQLPVVALVNAGSASSAELVAGALQDSGRAAIVGTPTFGKGSVQTIFELPGGSGMRLTTMRYYTPRGRSIQAEGIQPDVLLKPDERPRLGVVLRERDLSGHLPSEGREPAPRRGTTVEEADTPIGPGSVSDMPVDPDTGTDRALRVAYRELAHRIQETRATP